jgi:hypothetical protein
VPVTELAAKGASTASQVAPGVLGFLVVAALALALFFLIRSMNKHLRKVGADKRTFGPPPDPPPPVPRNVPNGLPRDS